MLIIFDLDGTLWDDDKYCMYKETEEVLRSLHVQKNILVVCSYNPEAPEIVRKVGCDHYFSTIIGDPSKSKYDMQCR